MDVLDEMLASMRADGSLLCRSVAAPPWSIQCTSEAPLSLGTLHRGTAWALRPGAAPVRLNEGDIVLKRASVPVTIADDPSVDPQIIIDGPNCWTPGDGPAPDLALGARAFGFDGDGPDQFISADYPVRGAVSEPLLAALPEMAIVPRDAEIAPLLDLLAVEVGRDAPGQQVVLDRLLDLLLVRVLRAWFARPEAEAPAGYRALADPEIGRALRALHAAPARPWTVASLAAEAGLSRAVFARRFAALVGQPPLAYLTGWRMALAADLLAEPDASVTAVARRVGYADGFSFSAAFKRVRGVPPSAVPRSGAVDRFGHGGAA
ncbi:AraC family transcriptional regulator [Actinomadura flavalba]|uniref:AraC family transcriptional regulator n=1 Tax=Actinomadura flavalba TaxID=1120938 RepID=UPI00035FC0C9|nr:AraC family transcriptional regulator [Actinomadura flavalba]